MRCPQCGTRNVLGSASCSNCGRPFTSGQRRDHSAGARDAQPSPSEETIRIPTAEVRQARPDVHVHYERDAYDDEYDYYEEPYAAPPVAARRGMNGCLMSLMIMLAVSAGVIIGAIMVTNMYVKPRVNDAISSYVGAGIEDTVREQVNLELADMPSGDITVSEADINQQISEQGNLGPVDDLNVSIDPDGIDASLQAYGLSGNYSGDVYVEDGQIRLRNSNVSGPLQYVVSQGDIEQIASNAINRALQESGYVVEAVTLQDGWLVLTLLRQAG